MGFGVVPGRSGRKSPSLRSFREKLKEKLSLSKERTILLGREDSLSLLLVVFCLCSSLYQHKHIRLDGRAKGAGIFSLGDSASATKDVALPSWAAVMEAAVMLGVTSSVV